jgi:putative FmdB family regulatory protein
MSQVDAGGGAGGFFNAAAQSRRPRGAATGLAGQGALTAPGALISFAAASPGGRMPIYEYRCEKCGDFEVTQRITEEPLKKCPTCKRKVRKLISNTSFQLKGSGWYVTDYARKDKSGGKEATGGESSAKSESGTSAEPKSESKSAKSESKPKKPSAKAA